MREGLESESFLKMRRSTEPVRQVFIPCRLAWQDYGVWEYGEEPEIETRTLDATSPQVNPGSQDEEPQE